MKKLFALALAAVMLLTFAACGGSEAPATEPSVVATVAPTAAPETEAPTEEATEAVITSLDMEETVLVDDENCTFAVSLATENAYLGMTMDAVCVNKTGRTLLFAWNSVSVCGYMYDPLWSEQVGPGETVSSVIYIDTYQLEQYGVTSVDEIEFTLNIFDSEDFMAEPYVNDVFNIYPTGLNAETFTYPERISVGGEQVIADNEDLSFIIESISEDSETVTLRCYLGNRTGSALLYAWDGVTVNGCAIDPVWSAQVAAGKQAYSEITFYRADLDASGVELVEEIGFSLIVTDSDDWEAEPVLEEEYLYQAISG